MEITPNTSLAPGSVSSLETAAFVSYGAFPSAKYFSSLLSGSVILSYIYVAFGSHGGNKQYDILHEIGIEAGWQ